jgi:hypothetical protein
MFGVSTNAAFHWMLEIAAWFPVPKNACRPSSATVAEAQARRRQRLVRRQQPAQLLGRQRGVERTRVARAVRGLEVRNQRDGEEREYNLAGQLGGYIHYGEEQGPEEVRRAERVRVPDYAQLRALADLRGRGLDVQT